MANTTIEELLNLAYEVRDADQAGENTALRVGGLLEEIIQYLSTFVDLETLQDILEDYATVTGGGLISWRQSRIICLASMGYDLDNIDGGNWNYTNINGDIVFRPSGGGLLKVVGATGDFSVFPNVVYVNNHTGHAYLWQLVGNTYKMVEIRDSSTTTIITYLNTPPFSQVAVGESYFYTSGSTRKIAIKLSSDEVYSFDPDPKKIYVFLDTKQAMVWDSGNRQWISVGGNLIQIINDLTTGGEGDALSAEMGKRLGDSAQVGMYYGAPSEEPDTPEDVDVTFDNTELVSGKRIAAGAGGIGTINADTTRATITIMYYIGSGEAPAGTEKLDMAKFKSFTVPTGYYGSPTFAKATTMNAQAVYPSGWQTGTYTITDDNRATVAEYPYMVWNFGKGSNKDQTIGSADIDALIAGFKMTLEGEVAEPVDPAFIMHKAISVVDENGDEVLAMSSPAATEGGETDVYSKDAVDNLLANFTPTQSDTGSYRIPKAGIETDDEQVMTFSPSDFSVGVRIVGGSDGIANVSSNTTRATLNKIYYCGEGDAPSGTEKFDLSKFASFYVPSGYNGSPTFAAGLQRNASAVYPTGWQTGLCEITAEHRAAAANYPYMVFNFTKGSGSSTIDSSDLTAIAAGFEITSIAAATNPASAAIEIVDANGVAMKKIYNDDDHNTVSVYSKPAIDTLLSNVIPNPFDSARVRRVLRVCHWNVGQFSLGAAQQGTKLSNNYVKKWQNKLRQIGADAMLMCEFYTDNNMVSSIFSDYVYQNTDRLESSGNYIWSAIMSNIALGNVERVVFNNQSYRNFLAATISIGKWSVTLIECHLYFNGSETATRAAQMQQIIDYCANIDRVIICGDFNNADITEYAVFKNAGYQMFNYDLFNRVNTYPATGLTDQNYTSGFPSIAIDNIMCKGCSIVAAEVVDDGSLTDHCGVVCDIVLD